MNKTWNTEAGGVLQLLECLSLMHEALFSNPSAVQASHDDERLKSQ